VIDQYGVIAVTAKLNKAKEIAEADAIKGKLAMETWEQHRDSARLPCSYKSGVLAGLHNVYRLKRVKVQ